MAVFESTDDLYGIFTPYLERIVADPQIGPKFVAANTAFRVNYSDPSAVFAVDARQNPPAVLTGAAAAEHEVEVDLTMSADDGHRFWLGKLNIPVALARRKVKVDGPITKLLGILPALNPAFAMYRAYLTEIGHDSLV
jgi:hypothetical protein